MHRRSVRIDYGVVETNGDGTLDIIVAQGNGLYVYDHSGALRPGWPVMSARNFQSPAVGDITGDGVPEIVAHEQTGLLVRPGSVPELASGIDRLLSDEARRAAMGRAGRERVEQMFTAPEMARRVESVWERVYSRWCRGADGRAPLAR